MFPGYLQDFSRMFSGCSNGSCGPGGIWWTFQMKGIRSSPTIWWPQLIDDRQLFDDKLEVWTLIIQYSTVIPPSLMVLFSVVNNHVQTWIWWFGSFSASLDSLRIQEGQFWVLGTFVSFFSCPAQLNRWPCHSLSEWVRSLLISEHYNHYNHYNHHNHYNHYNTRYMPWQP